MAYGYKPKTYGQTAVGGRQGLSVPNITPLGISTRTNAKPKPAFKTDAIGKALSSAGSAVQRQVTNQRAANLPQQPPAPAPGDPQANPLSYDYAADPILNQITALSSRGRSDAQSEALKLRKQLAIDYGDQALGTSLGDTGTAQAAASNPFSVRKQLDTGYQKGVQGLEENYNNQNLFYGGHRAQGLADYATQYQGQLAGAAGQEQQALDAITRNLAAALGLADQQDIAGQTDAYGRSLGSALDAGVDPGALATGPAAAPPLGAANPASVQNRILGDVSRSTQSAAQTSPIAALLSLLAPPKKKRTGGGPTDMFF